MNTYRCTLLFVLMGHYAPLSHVCLERTEVFGRGHLSSQHIDSGRVVSDGVSAYGAAGIDRSIRHSR